MTAGGPERAGTAAADRGAGTDDGTRVPYRRWRRWVRSLRRRAVLARAAESGADPHDRVYLIYGVVLLGLVYGPVLWSAVAVAGTLLAGLPVSRHGAALAAVAVLGTAAACAGAAVASRAGGPLWVSPPEATFVLAGQFRAREVLWRRAVALAAGIAAVGAFVVTAVAHGAGAPPGLVGVGGVGAALLAQVPLAVGVAAQTARGRFDVDAAAAGFRRTATAGVGLLGGDSGAVAGVLGPQVHAGRRATLPRALLRRAPVAARDLLGLRRRPAAAAWSVVAGVLGAVLVALGAVAGPLATVAGACVLYGAAATWCAGLRAMAAQPEPGALLPGSVPRVIAAHAVVPALVALAVTALAAGAAVVLGLSAWSVAVPVVAVLVVVLASRLWVAGATAAPPGLFTPMMTPAGDASMLVLGAWYVRGWLVVTGAAWLMHRTGGDGTAASPGAVVVALLVAAWLVSAGVRRFVRA